MSVQVPTSLNFDILLLYLGKGYIRPCELRTYTLVLIPEAIDTRNNMKEYALIVLLFFLAIHSVPTLAGLCPNGWSGLLPDPETCGRFYQCSNGYPYSFECPANLHFNPKLLVCDWPENAGCVVTTTTTTPKPPPTTTTTPPPPPTTTTKPPPTTTTKPPPPPKPTTTPAPPPTTLPPTEPPTTEPPTETTTSLPEETTVPEDFEDPPVTTLLPESTTTDDYDLVPTTLLPDTDESGSGEEGSGEELVVRCPTENHGADIFLPDTSDCNGFYYCNWGTAIPQHCPSGLHWSVRLSVCTYPAQAECTF